MRLDELTLATFEPLVGEPFTLGAGSESVALVLESATLLAGRPGARDPFSLVLRGPTEPLLAQAIYALDHAKLGRLEIFIVPIGRDETGVGYEAIFS
jgi:hypothetical protein